MSIQKPLSQRDPAIRIVPMPRDTNEHGTIFGGVILSYIDLAGAIEARRHTRHRIVTVAMKEVVFKEPVRVGEVVSFYSSTTRIGNTSIAVHVDVEVNKQGEVRPVTEADLVFVCVDAQGRPIPVRREP